MAKDPAFLFYPGDYLRDTQCLSERSQVAYDRIMCEHMRNICITQQQLKFFTKRLTGDEKDELNMILTKVDDGYQIDWVVDSILKRRAYSESRRRNRKSKSKKTSESYDEHMEDENKDNIEYRKDIFFKDCALVNEERQILTNEGMTNEHGNGFLDYWMEMGPRDKKMRFEKQASFDHSRRMKMWARNNKKWNTTDNDRYKVEKVDYHEKWKPNQE